MTLEEYNKLRNSIDKIADLLIEILSVIKAEQQQAQQPEQPKLERRTLHSVSQRFGETSARDSRFHTQQATHE